MRLLVLGAVFSITTNVLQICDGWDLEAVTLT
jgi:hypothetical protein